jgi:hypothetical protein
MLQMELVSQQLIVPATMMVLSIHQALNLSSNVKNGE